MPETLPRLTSALSDRYRIERELGAGGMATVYLAHDLRHDRPVALKLLRPELAAILGGERFLVEIKTTANLQHPHILSLYDSGEAGGLVYYVMPYVDGESLRDRLTREHQLPVEEAVRIAREVADALDYAHRHGVVHRDIKPENILLHDGRAMVADFGIALAASRSEGGTRMTETGMSLGTPYYMAPEQAMGQKEITGRADVYALGCVLYEMLTGEPPFTGPTPQAIVARVMTEAPRSLTLQRHTVPPHVEAAVQKALEKLPADRFVSAAQFGEAIAGTGAAVPVTYATGAAAAARARERGWRSLVPWAVALLGVAAGAWGWAGGRAAAPAVSRHRIVLAESVGVRTPLDATIALSPDGRRVAFVDSAGPGRLWVRRLEDLDARPLPGTEGARWPTFSPDGEWLAYVVGTRLTKIRADGGAAIPIADSASSGFGGVAWLDDNTIVYTGMVLDLRRVSAAGGPVAIVNTAAQLLGGGMGVPTPLPGARGVLLQYCTSNCVSMTGRVLDLRSGEMRDLATDVVRAWYVPTGHLVYVRRDGAVLAAPFDLDRLALTGPAVPVLDDVQVLNTVANLAFAQNGTLIYASGRGAGGDNATVLRVDRAGRTTVLDSAWRGAFNSLALSPDGGRIAVGTIVGTARDIWVKQLARGPFSRLTFSGTDQRPAWSPDGTTIAFVRLLGATGEAWVRSADGSGDDRLVARIGRLVQEVAWSGDGAWLVLRTDNTEPGRGDIIGVRVNGDSTPVPLVATPYEELHPTVSPDGRWIAYTSDESGRQEVYVRPFPNTAGGRWLVSVDGGRIPVWSADGRELFYLDPSLQLVSAHITPGPAFGVTAREPLFSASAALRYDIYHTSFAVSRDGRSFYILGTQSLLDAAAPTTRLVLVENWFTELRQRVEGR